MGTNATLNLIDNIEVGFNVSNGVLEGLQTSSQGIAVNGAKIGVPAWNTELTLIAGATYIFNNADMRDAVFPVNTGDQITIVANGTTQLPTLPNGYLIPTTLTLAVNFPSGYDTTRANIGVYSVNGETVTQIGAFNDLTFSSGDVAGLGSSIRNLRAVVTGEGINTFVRDFTIEGDLTFTIDISTDTAFNSWCYTRRAKRD